MLGSIGVIVASGVIMRTGWTLADPIVGAAIGLFIIPRTWKLLMEAVHILMEGTPSHLDLWDIQTCLQAIDGVLTVHDLHVWTITSGLDSLSAHVIVRDGIDSDELLTAIQAALKTEFHIEHTTIQVEGQSHSHVTLPI